MNNRPSRSPRLDVSAEDIRDDAWHDLVAAVVACAGAPRVAPPAALRAEIERKLGFAQTRSGVSGLRWVFAAAAAACVLMLAWQAGRVSIGRDAGEAVASSIAGRPDQAAGEFSREGGAARATVVISPPPARGEAPEADAVAKAGAEGESTSTALALKARSSADQRAGAFAGKVEGGAGAALAGGLTRPWVNAEAVDAAAEELLSKSGFYVAGMLAAAMQTPPTANPYEASQQIVEWTEWTAGYERGSELPAAVVLAWGDAFAAQNPDDPALSASMAGGEGTPTLSSPEDVSGSTVKLAPEALPVGTQQAK